MAVGGHHHLHQCVQRQVTEPRFYMNTTAVSLPHPRQETQLSLVVSDLQGHPMSIIYMSFENQYATSYQ